MERSLRKYEKEIQESEMALTKINESVLSIEKTLLQEKEELQKQQKYIKNYDFLLDEIVESENEQDDKLGEGIWIQKEISLEKIKTLEENITSYSSFYETVFSERNALKEKVNEKKQVLSKLKVKKEAAENLKRLNGAMKQFSNTDHSFSGMNELEESIKKNLYAETEKSKMISEENEVTRSLTDTHKTGYYAFKQKRLKEKQNKKTV